MRFPGLRPPEPVDPDLPLPTPQTPNKGVRVARRRRLLRIAAEQHGLFTVAQAAAAGLDRRARYHHLSYGNWRRTDAPDVLRLTGWPPDPKERLRAWMLWAGPGAVLTSWTALGLSGLTASGPRVPVDLEIPFGRDRAGQRRRRRLEGQIPVYEGVVGAHLHPAAPERPPVVDGLAVRPPAEALCAAINHRPRSIALGFAAELLDRGHLEMSDMVLASQLIGCPRLADLLFERLAR